MQQKPLKKNFKFVPKCAEFCSASDEYLNTLITLFLGGFYFLFSYFFTFVCQRFCNLPKEI